MKTIQNKLLSAVILLILATINCTAQNRFPDGETRYYATADKSIIFNLQFYYDKGDRCAIYKNNAWRGGIKLKDFGMKNGKADYGQFKDMPRIGANYTVYYERIRNYLHSWLESMLVSPDFSHITIKGAYNYSASFSRISKAEYDRLYAKFTKGNSGGSYSSGKSTYVAPPRGTKKPSARIVKVACYACNGTRRCAICGGTGDMGDSHNFHKEKVVMRCSTCSGTGTCQSCHGKGYTTQVVSD